MKMVIVFDTDDRNGMINTIKIVDNLAYEYLGRGVKEAHNRTFGKIEFIKMLRIFAQTVKAEVDPGTVVKILQVNANGAHVVAVKWFTWDNGRTSEEHVRELELMSEV